jgi:nucleoside-diphosphate-sugar epimerase
MKTCVVTGSTGFLGRNLVPSLLKAREVSAIVRSEPIPATEFPHLSYVKKDISTNFDFSGFPEQVDSVIHLAQSHNFRGFPDYTNDIFSVNTASVARLLDYALKANARTFILASTGGIGKKDGTSDFTFSSDKHKHSEINYYLHTKLCAEILASSYTDQMNVIILRFFFLYGPGQREDMLMARLMKSVKQGKAVYLNGNNEGDTINPLFISDAVNAIEKALNIEGSHCINVAGPETVTIRGLCEQIGRHSDSIPRFEMAPDQKTRDLTGDISVMKDRLGTPCVGICDGLNYILSLNDAEQPDQHS